MHFAEPAPTATRAACAPESFADHYSQARLFFRSQSALEQAHIASALVFELSKVETEHVRLAVLAQLQNVDAVAGASGGATDWACDDLPAPRKAALRRYATCALSPALRIIDRMKPTLQGRCIGILVSDGTDMAGGECAAHGGEKGRCASEAGRAETDHPRLAVARP